MTPLPPGKTLGILGGGQLGRFLAEAARALGYRTAALDSAADCPALQVVDVPVVGSVDDPRAARRLARASDLVTLEWELVSAAARASSSARAATSADISAGARVARRIPSRWRFSATG